MIVEAQVGIAVGKLWVIESKDLLLDDDALRLELDRLQKVAHLVLDVGHLCNACGNFWVHRTSNLEQQIDDLIVQIESFLILSLVAGSDRFLHHLAGILVLVIQVLYNREEVGNDASLEGHVPVLVQLLIADQD